MARRMRLLSNLLDDERSMEGDAFELDRMLKRNRVAAISPSLSQASTVILNPLTAATPELSRTSIASSLSISPSSDSDDSVDPSILAARQGTPTNPVVNLQVASSIPTGPVVAAQHASTLHGSEVIRDDAVPTDLAPLYAQLKEGIGKLKSKKKQTTYNERRERLFYKKKKNGTKEPLKEIDGVRLRKLNNRVWAIVNRQTASVFIKASLKCKKLAHREVKHDPNKAARGNVQRAKQHLLNAAARLAKEEVRVAANDGTSSAKSLAQLERDRTLVEAVKRTGVVLYGDRKASWNRIGREAAAQLLGMNAFPGPQSARGVAGQAARTLNEMQRAERGRGRASGIAAAFGLPTTGGQRYGPGFGLV